MGDQRKSNPASIQGWVRPGSQQEGLTHPWLCPGTAFWLNCSTDLTDTWQPKYQPTCRWKGSHVLQDLKNIPQLGPCECLETAEQEGETLAMLGCGRGAALGLRGLHSNSGFAFL